ncbi:disease resistance protein PIK6-NP-like [Miscanthus floridulus]|uniref:disease resistance protein PIK6-NP-like n=1 Tax=Miscanthus floridulus TaxID=154761 RepID=UPI00345981DD
MPNLMAADEEQGKHKVLLTWVKQVREAAYNVEDSLMGFSVMDFSVHSDERPSCWWCIPRVLWERRNIAKEVKELRTRVEDVSNRNLRYRLIKGSGSKPTTTAEEQASIASAAMSGINEAMRTAMEQVKTIVDLCHLINDGDEDHRVIAMWGESSDDTRMISAIQKVYDDSTVTANFGFRAWVTIMHPFDPIALIQSLVRQFYENFPEKLDETTHRRKTIGASVYMKMQSMTPSEITDVLDTQVSDNSYLIVIDDLSTIMEWNCINKYFPQQQEREQRIIVSTPHFRIANMCAEKPCQISELKQLSSHPTIYLFHKVTLRLQ